MSCLGRAAVPARRVWRGLRERLGLRRTAGKSPASYVPMSPGSDGRSDVEVAGVVAGLGRLRKEVRTCEYRDVHVMWEMLSNTGASNGGGDGAMADVAAGKPTPTRRRARRGRKTAAWSHRLVSYCCAL